MDAKTIKHISQSVYRRFPEVAGSKPKVKAYVKPRAKSLSGEATYLLIFQGRGSSPQGKSLPRRVRVIANARGKILKISTSR